MRARMQPLMDALKRYVTWLPCVQATDRGTGSGLNPHQVALALTFGVWGGASALVAGC